MMTKPPVPTGEYAVGTLTYTVKNDREDVLCPPAMRSVAARVYYPVLKESVAGLEKAHHITRNIATALKKVFFLPVNYDKLEAAGKNVSECYPDAPRIPGKKFPLVIFNHGYFSYREGNSFLCIELASHGYVVISVAHSFEALCAEFDDGTSIFYDKRLSHKTYEPFWRGVIKLLKLVKQKGTNEELAQKFDDFQDVYCKFQKGRVPEWVKDTNAALNYAKENLADLIDFEKGIGASGHSFGGDTSYALCASNPDFACGINIDGALFGDYRNTVQTKPFMQISCKANENVVTRVYVKHTKPVTKVIFRDMSHMGFSDMKHMISMKSSVGKLGADEMHENLCKCHLEFFDTWLKKAKPHPELTSNDVITVTEYAPDLT